jgi:peptidoglycan DL-endopeptidase CwlO
VASHRRPNRPSKTRFSVVTAAAVTAVAFAPNVSRADPAPTRDQVERRINTLHHEAEIATEQYNGFEEKQGQLQERITRTQARIAQTQSDLLVLRDAMGAMASAQYRNGGVDPTLRLMMSRTPDRYLSQAAVLDRIGARQKNAITRVRSTKRTLQQERREAADALADLESTRKAIATKKSDIETKLTRARELLNSLSEQERRALLAQEGHGEQPTPPTSAVPASDRASRDEPRPGTPKPTEKAAPTDRRGPGTSIPVSGRAGAAVFAARRAIGRPYVYGAVGPNSFDCSGLTGWAWKQAGVSLPRTSQAQAGAGRSIPVADIQPGDLVVYYSDASHVGIYVGGGQIVHAPKPGTNVRYAPLNSMKVAKVVRVS